MNLTSERLALLAERLRLPDLPAELPVLAEQAAAGSWSYAECRRTLKHVASCTTKRDGPGETLHMTMG